MAPRDTIDAKLCADLSVREGDVAAKFVAGMTYREIGEALFIAPTTVRTHLSVIYQKLGVHNKMALANHFPLSRPTMSGRLRSTLPRKRPVPQSSPSCRLTIWLATIAGHALQMG